MEQRRPIPKMLGRDCELSTTGIDAAGRTIDSWDVARAVLAHIGAAFEPARCWAAPRDVYWPSWSGAGSTDDLRHWAPNGQCFYVDLSHVEVCTAETRHPRVFAAQSLAALRVAEDARARAEAAADEGTRYWLSTATVDLSTPDKAWGAHINVSIATELWEDLFDSHARPARLAFVSSALAAAIPFFGCGYLLPDDEGPIFCLSSRAHHITKLSTLSTTTPYERGILNSRREPHGRGQDRLHLIGFDHALAGAALLATFVQCTLLCAEQGLLGASLDAPLDALWRWSIGLDLVSGRISATSPLAFEPRAVTLHGYVEELALFFLAQCDAGRIEEEHAPDARVNLERIADLARSLQEGSLERCAKHLDWAAKLLTLLELCERERVSLGDPSARILDHDFASTDPGRGVFWRLWHSGTVDPLVTPRDVEAELHDGPADGRGWTRGRMIRRFHERITRVDWSLVELARSSSRWEPRFALELARPDLFDRPRMERALERAHDVDELERSLAEARLGAGERTDPVLDVRRRIVRVPKETRPLGETP